MKEQSRTKCYATLATVMTNIVIWGAGLALFGAVVTYRIAELDPFEHDTTWNILALGVWLCALYGGVGLVAGLGVGIMVRIGWGIYTSLEGGGKVDIPLSTPSKGKTADVAFAVFVLLVCLGMLLRTLTHVETDIRSFQLFSYLLLFLIFAGAVVASVWVKAFRKSQGRRGLAIPTACFVMLLCTVLTLSKIDQPNRRQLSIFAELAELAKRPSRNFLGADSATEKPRNLPKLTEVSVDFDAGHLDRPQHVPKVLFLALDGASWDVIGRLVNTGKLPHIQSLIESGVRAKMATFKPLLSPIIWTTVATGKPPRKHGIAGFTVWLLPGMTEPFSELPGGVFTYRLLNKTKRNAQLPIGSSIRQCKSIWNICADNGISAGVVGWWASWPAEAINGFIVSDRITYSFEGGLGKALDAVTELTYPADLFREIKPLIRFPQEITYDQAKDYMSERGFLQTLDKEHDPVHLFKVALSTSQTYSTIGLKLRDQFHPDLFMLYLQGIDLVSHYFWKPAFPEQWENVPQELIDDYGRVIDRFYEYQDEVLGEYLSTADADTYVLIASDHGFKAAYDAPFSVINGRHSEEAVFILNGPGVKKGVEVEDVSVFDIAPTLLYVLGCPVPADMYGRVLLDSFDENFTAGHDLRCVKTYEGKPTGIKPGIKKSVLDDEVRSRLESIGYIQ